MSRDIQTLKGSNLRLGDWITIRITDQDGDTTTVSGIITGIQLWNPEVIAIHLANLGDWIQLRNNVEIGG